MVELQITAWSGDPRSAVTEIACEQGLQLASEGRLSKYSGSTHWHFTRPERPGTLEVTLWPREERLWVHYHSNRTGDGWVAGCAVRFAQRLALRLGGRAGSPEEPT
jgi:hypothetical protein